MDRGFATLLPDYLDDWIGEDNPVRLLAAFDDVLNLAESGFAVSSPPQPAKPDITVLFSSSSTSTAVPGQKGCHTLGKTRREIFKGYHMTVGGKPQVDGTFHATGDAERATPSIPSQSTAATTPALTTQGQSDGWRAVIADLVFGEKDGVFSVAAKMLWSPVETSLRLAADTSYHGYWKFMLACMGANLTLLFAVVPWIGSNIFHTPAQSRAVDSLTIQGLQLTGMPILTFVQFYLFSWLGNVRRTPLEYVRLCSLSVGYGWLLTLFTMLIEALFVVVLLTKDVPVDGIRADQLQSAAVMVFVVAYVTLTHRKFWGMSFLTAILSSAFIAALSWVIVYPGLAWIALALEPAGWLNELAN